MLVIKFFSLSVVLTFTVQARNSGTDDENKKYLKNFINQLFRQVWLEKKVEDIMNSLTGPSLKAAEVYLGAPSTLRLTEADGTYTLTTTTTSEMNDMFKFGKTFYSRVPGGEQVKSIFTQDRTTLTQTIFGPKNITIVREFNPYALHVITHLGDISARQVYKSEFTLSVR